MNQRSQLASVAFRSLDVLVSVSIVVMAGAVSWSISKGGVRTAAQAVDSKPRQEPPLPSEPLSLAGAKKRGLATARVALLVYSDFQCPYCATFAKEVMPVLESRYINSGQVLLAFRHLPLPIHQSAAKAAQIAECAGLQGQFWPVHDRLFMSPSSLKDIGSTAWGEGLPLRQEVFQDCVDAPSDPRVAFDVKTARQLGIRGTPTFFVGQLLEDGRLKVGKRFSGALPISRFEEIIGELLPRSTN